MWQDCVKDFENCYVACSINTDAISQVLVPFKTAVLYKLHMYVHTELSKNCFTLFSL